MNAEPLTYKDFSVSEWMKYTVNREDVHVFQISVYRHDYQDSFFATATIRAPTFGAPTYSCSGSTPEQALWEVNKILDSLTCPHCHQPIANDEVRLQMQLDKE